LKEGLAYETSNSTSAGRKELASTREAILRAIDDQARASQTQERSTSVDALSKQDVDVLATEFQGLAVTHGKVVDSMLSRMATKDDMQDIKTLLISQLQLTTPAQKSLSLPQDTSRMMLVLTIPQLHLSATDAISILQHFSAELVLILKAVLASFIFCLKDLLIALPQLILLYRVLKRLPQAISLVLHDNITFEDALGRMQSLQFQQFRHWTVFEASLRCKFDNLPGMRKVLSGEYILTTPRHRLQLTRQNWSEVIRPGFVIKMAIMINTVQTSYQKCPRECGSNVSKTTDVDYRCDDCGLVFAVQLRPPEFGSGRRNLEEREEVGVVTPSVLAALEKPKVPTPSLVGSKGHRSHPRKIKVLLSRSRARIQLTAPTFEDVKARMIEDAFLPSKLARQDDDDQESRTKAEAEELKVFKRVHLTGKDLLDYRFGFTSLKTPNPSPPPSFGGLNISAYDGYSFRDPTSGRKGPEDSSPHQPSPTFKVEKKFVCEGEVRSAPGTKWGCGRRYATANALSRHFHSAAGKLCIDPLFDEEPGSISSPPTRETGQLPQSLLKQYPHLLAIEQGRFQRMSDTKALSPIIYPYMTSDTKAPSPTISPYLMSDYEALDSTISPDLTSDYEALGSTISPDLMFDYEALGSTISPDLTSDSEVPRYINCAFKNCEWIGESSWDFEDHCVSHDLHYVCRVPDCIRRGRGFASLQDLKRFHQQRFMHKPLPGALEQKPGGTKPKTRFDVEKKCGVQLLSGGRCVRSITCKTHSMEAKRAVSGRSLPYDMLLAAYQKNQARQPSKQHPSPRTSGEIDANVST
jgi:SCA7, zinc-binding domain